MDINILERLISLLGNLASIHSWFRPQSRSDKNAPSNQPTAPKSGTIVPKDPVPSAEAAVVGADEDRQPSEIAARLRYVVDVISTTEPKEGSRGRLADAVGVKETALYRYLAAEEEPPRELLRRFADHTGTLYEYLCYGEEKPFVSGLPHRTCVRDHAIDILKLSPREACFVRCKDDGSATVLARSGALSWTQLPRAYAIRDQVGGTGANQLLDFARLIHDLKRELRFLTGLHLESEKFWALVKGEIYPGSVRPRLMNDYWWMDLFDAHHCLREPATYRRWYGKTFLGAQRLLLYNHFEYIDPVVRQNSVRREIIDLSIGQR